MQKYRLSYVREDCADYFGHTVTAKSDVISLLSKFLGDLPVEKFVVFALDTGNRVTGYIEEVGSIGQCHAYPANVFRFLLSCGAAAFIIAHNHPGGTCHASNADWTLTAKLKCAGDALDIRLLDHIIVVDGQSECVSLRDHAKWSKL